MYEKINEEIVERRLDSGVIEYRIVYPETRQGLQIATTGAFICMALTVDCLQQANPKKSPARLRGLLNDLNTEFGKWIEHEKTETWYRKDLLFQLVWVEKEAFDGVFLIRQPNDPLGQAVRPAD